MQQNEKNFTMDTHVINISLNLLYTYLSTYPSLKVMVFKLTCCTHLTINSFA